jgi:hypothetical protein
VRCLTFTGSPKVVLMTVAIGEARASVDALRLAARASVDAPRLAARASVDAPRLALGDVLADLRGALDRLHDLDPVMLGDGDTVVALWKELARVEALVCRQSATFDRCGDWALDGAQNAAAWVTTQARCDRAQARRRVRLGLAMRWIDLVRAAFVAGRIGIDHADLLAAARDRSKATADAFDRDQAMLVDWAESMKFHKFTHKLEEWVQRADVDAAEKRAERQYRQRRFHLSQSFENAWFADGMFDPISGQIIHDTLSGIERELFEADWAEATERLDRDPAVCELARTAPQRRVDALVEMARRAEATPKDGQRPAPLFTVLVGVDAFTRTCELASGTILTPGALARWVDESMIERIVFDGPERVMAVGRQRAFTGALRRAIQVRDRTCQHPFCDQPAEHCQIDHVNPWALGGETAPQNAKLLCGFHNRLRNQDLRNRYLREKAGRFSSED